MLSGWSFVAVHKILNLNVGLYINELGSVFHSWQWSSSRFWPLFRIWKSKGQMIWCGCAVFARERTLCSCQCFSARVWFRDGMSRSSPGLIHHHTSSSVPPPVQTTGISRKVIKVHTSFCFMIILLKSNGAKPFWWQKPQKCGLWVCFQLLATTFDVSFIFFPFLTKLWKIALAFEQVQGTTEQDEMSSLDIVTRLHDCTQILCI